MLADLLARCRRTGTLLEPGSGLEVSHALRFSGATVSAVPRAGHYDPARPAMPARRVEIDVRIERKQPDLPGYVLVPAAAIARWKLDGTTSVEGTIDGLPLGRRSLKRWDDERWFLELRREHLSELKKAPGDAARLAIAPASTELPAELSALIEAEPAAHARWDAHTDAQRRMLREEILGLKTAAGRERRSRRALLPEPEPACARVRGLPAEPRKIALRIVARNLPGRDCGPYREVAVGFVAKTGCHPAAFVDGGARGATWDTTIELRDDGGVPAFRGPAVNGPPRERFLYLTWIGRLGDAAPAMFRRAKLRLDAIPASVLSAAARTGALVGTVGLTDDRGMPLCASVKPPAIAWSADA